MRELLRDRSFRLLWTAHVGSSFGDALTSLALLLIAQRLTGSTAAVAGVAVAIAVPQLLVGLVAGVFVDRWDRRRVMVVADLGRAALVLAFLAVTSADRLWLLYAIAFAQSAVGTFFNPARATLLAEVLPSDRLLAANSLSEMSRVVAGVAGVAAAGALATTSSSLGVVFVVDAITFAASAALVSSVSSVGSRDGSVRQHVRVELATGLRLILGSRLLVGVVTAGAVAMLGLGAVNVLLVPFVVRDIGASEAWFGALEAAQVAALVSAGALVAALGTRLHPTRLITGGALGLGASVTVLAVCHAPWQLMLVFFAAGWFVPPIQASAITLLQTTVPAELRARAQSAFATLVSGASVASMAFAGTAAAVSGVRAVFIGAGVIVASAGFAALLAFRTATPPASTPLLGRG